ncbi:NlpC/P60 family protein [Streptomyces sp. BBFR102]|uniref:NlpC/P60 family protein n=1 Tax=Streptomyces sp. BBFR102 TaxID=3448171 RepID=UPI003F53881F
MLAATAVAVACGHLTPALADEPPPSLGAPARLTDAAQGSPQGAPAPLYGPPGRPSVPLPGPPATPPTTREAIIERAEKWTRAKVPYAMDGYGADGYRQDCSGFVSMAWNLGRSEWTGSLAGFAERITKDELRPGDILLFHNAENPEKGSHVTLFGGWTNSSRTQYTAYEQTRPATRRQATPYAYWTNGSRFLPYRYRGLAEGRGRDIPAERAAPGAPGAERAGAVPAHPGAAVFRPGRSRPAGEGFGRRGVRPRPSARAGAAPERDRPARHR